LDGYVLEGIGGAVEIMSRDGLLEGEVGLEGADLVLIEVSLGGVPFETGRNGCGARLRRLCRPIEE
jgi:hypothetical protein